PERLVFLPATTAARDAKLRPPFLRLLELAERSVQPVVGVLADRASIEHDQVGAVRIGRARVALRLQEPCDPLRVVLVHLAAEGTDEISRHPLILGPGRPAPGDTMGPREARDLGPPGRAP